ncbi:signal peptidase I [Nonomuraea pusilla]|uniref:signal peptidase I n=1 Tax=Nonomuraea pusilla TaxID=46177 RepID=UPI0033314E7D
MDDPVTSESGGPVGQGVYVGNAEVDGAADAGWLLGHFRPPGDPRHSADVEIKWGVHAPGDERARWVRGEARTALLVLISGRFRVELPGRSVLLSKRGDYVVWGRGVDHSWRAEEESVVLTVRWPSIPGYKVPEGEVSGGEVSGGEVSGGEVSDGEVLDDRARDHEASGCSVSERGPVGE